MRTTNHIALPVGGVPSLHRIVLGTCVKNGGIKHPHGPTLSEMSDLRWRNKKCHSTCMFIKSTFFCRAFFRRLLFYKQYQRGLRMMPIELQSKPSRKTRKNSNENSLRKDLRNLGMSNSARVPLLRRRMMTERCRPSRFISQAVTRVVYHIFPLSHDSSSRLP